MARRVLGNIEKRIDSKCSVAEVGCSHFNQNYELYVHFDVPPEPKVVCDLLFRAFDGMPLLSLDMVNPFTNKADGKETVGTSAADAALDQVKRNQTAIKQKVTDGREFCVIKSNPLYS